jgi:hypothetical protein
MQILNGLTVENRMDLGRFGCFKWVDRTRFWPGVVADLTSKTHCEDPKHIKGRNERLTKAVSHSIPIRKHGELMQL